MSNSMYSNIDTDDIFSSAMEDPEIVESPFGGGENDDTAGLSEPLHAVDAARRLLGNDDFDDNAEAGLGSGAASINQQTPAFSQPPNAPMGNSLFERIQQQKKQQGSGSISAPPPAAAPPAPFPPATTTPPTTNFGYPMVEEGNYSTTGVSSSSTTTNNNNNNNNNIHIPEYSQAPAPNAYNPDSAYNAHLNHQSSGPASSGDYKDKFMSALSMVGSAAGTVAVGAYQGGKQLVGKMTKINSGRPSHTAGSSGGQYMGVGGGGGSGGNNVGEMDYQRESLLMDPHDLEDRAAMSMADPSSTDPMSSSSSMMNPSGMRAGIINANSINDSSSTCLNFVKQFAMDMKDLFLGASRRVQIGVVLLVVFIIWLIFFE